MSRTIRRKTGMQPTFDAGWHMAWAAKHGKCVQAAYDEEVEQHADWVARSGRDGYEGRCSRSQRLKHAYHRAIRQEWRVQKAATRQLGTYGALGPYDCGCDYCDDAMIHAPFVDHYTAGPLAVNRWDFY